jgi:hypothetical protein
MGRIGTTTATALTLSLTLLTVTAATPVRANVFQEQDAQGLDALGKRIDLATGDNIAVGRSLLSQRAFEAADCLQNIVDQLQSIDDKISNISTLIRISAFMTDPADEAVVDTYLAIDITSAVKSLAIYRQSVNNNAGYCASSPIIATRAQAALAILENAEHLLLGLDRRR